MNEIQFIQLIVVFAVLLALPAIAYVLNRSIAKHLETITRRINDLQKLKLLELAKELLIFFGTSKASNAVQKLIRDVERNASASEFSLHAAAAIPDIEKLNSSLSDVLNPMIGVSRIKSHSRYLLLLVLLDGIILSAIILIMLFKNSLVDTNLLYLSLEYLDVGWAIVFSVVFIWISRYIVNFEKREIIPLLDLDQLKLA